ncbi:MAG: substrate-binding domain-containing protein [Bacteroidales bacterium]
MPERKIDAIIFATNTLTIKGLYFLLRQSIKVPDELAIIGFDGGEAFDFFYAPLTYIKQPIQEMARESVRLLTEQINGTKKADKVRLMHRFIERQSSG